MKYLRVKDFTLIINGVGVNPELQGNTFGEIPFFRNSDFSKEGNEIYLQNSESNFSLEEIKQYGFRLTPKNSLVFSKVGESIKKNHRKFTQNVSVIDNNLSAFLINKKINKQYFYWFLKTIDFANYLVPSTIPVLNTSLVKNIIVPNIFPYQQTAIANYLDHHTSKIDKEISLLEQKVEKLDEYKQSLIYETVTKGLDKNVPMKDSGIEWLGMIPEHWTVKRVKDVSKIFKGKANELFSEKEDGMLPCIDTNYLRKREGAISYNNQGVKITPGKVLILWDGANAGELFLNNNLGYLGSTFGAFKTKINNKFWFYYLKGIEKNSRNNLVGMGIPHVNGTVLRQTLAILPPQVEQQQIAKYLDVQCSNIDKKKELINKKIELIKEYKQSLIYEAVTGKLDVL